MLSLLRPGQTLRCVSSGIECRVEKRHGGGGQGEVYRVSAGGERHALKWYNDAMLAADPLLRGRLEAAIRQRAPSPRFLWPFELVTLPDGSRLGYLMPERNESYRSLHELIASTEGWPSFRVLTTIAFNLADAFLQLHTKGFSYQDVSPGNVFFDPAAGDIQISDNDNVDVDGRPSVMGGTREYQAPELVEQAAGPSRTTDLHALAVLLFRVLLVDHPLVGKRDLRIRNAASREATRLLFGREALFVFDPDDRSNEPLPERHAALVALWPALPHHVRELFTRAFTTGLRDPAHGRVQEGEWRRAMAQLRDAILPCPRCGYENFYDPRRLALREATFACWNPECRTALAAGAPRIGLRASGASGASGAAGASGARGTASEPPQSVVVLAPGTRLYPHHLHGRDYDFSAAVAEVTGEPLALKNLSREAWTAIGAAERREVIEPGASVRLEARTRIRFGLAEGEVKT